MSNPHQRTRLPQALVGMVAAILVTLAIPVPAASAGGVYWYYAIENQTMSGLRVKSTTFFDPPVTPPVASSSYDSTEIRDGGTATTVYRFTDDAGIDHRLTLRFTYSGSGYATPECLLDTPAFTCSVREGVDGRWGYVYGTTVTLAKAQPATIPVLGDVSRTLWSDLLTVCKEHRKFADCAELSGDYLLQAVVGQTTYLVRKVPPQILTSSFPAAMSTVYYQRGIRVTSPVDPNVTVSATGLPGGLTYQASSQAIVGVPTQAGTFPIEITAASIYGTTTKVVPLTVTWAAPRFLTTALGEGTVGKMYTQWIGLDRRGAPGGATSLRITGLPPGLWSNNLGIFGSPTQAGTFSVRLTATTVDGGSSTKVLQLVVRSGQ